MKKFFIVFFTIISCDVIYCQKTVSDSLKFYEHKPTLGYLEREVRYEFPNTILSVGTAKSYIRALAYQNEIKYSLGININNANTLNNTVFLSYEELVEIIKAINVINMKSNSDLSKNYDYVDNRHVLSSDVIVGCLVDNQILNWYFNYLDNLVFKLYFTSFDQALKFFQRAKDKIDVLTSR
jgi:hypothetical protein